MSYLSSKYLFHNTVRSRREGQRSRVEESWPAYQTKSGLHRNCTATKVLEANMQAWEGAARGSGLARTGDPIASRGGLDASAKVLGGRGPHAGHPKPSQELPMTGTGEPASHSFFWPPSQPWSAFL